MSGEEAPGGNDFLAFNSNDGPHTKPNQFRPYNNNQWRNSGTYKSGNFSPQGFSSPIGGGGFRGGRPRFNQDNRHGNPHNDNNSGRNRLPRSFGNQRPYHNRRGGGGGEQQQRSFQKINFQPAGNTESPNMSNYYHPSMTEDPWKHFNLDDVKKNISATNVDPEQTNSDSSENPDDDSIV